MNGGIVWVSALGDDATFNYNQTPDGTMAIAPMLFPPRVGTV
jgi:hypothetical protein